MFDAAPDAGKLTQVARVATAPKARTGLFIPDLDILAVAAPRTSDGPASVLVYRLRP